MSLSDSNPEMVISEKNEKALVLAVDMFKHSGRVADRFSLKASETKEKSGIVASKISELIEKAGIFNDDKQKANFESELDELTNVPEAQKILGHPFVGVLVNLAMPAILKIIGNKGGADNGGTNKPEE